MKKNVAGGMIALSMLASSNLHASDTELLDLDNLDISSQGEVLVSQKAVKPIPVFEGSDIYKAKADGINYWCTNSGCTEK